MMMTVVAPDTLPDLPINVESLIREAREARARQADEQVTAHIRAVLSRRKSHSSSGSGPMEEPHRSGPFETFEGSIGGLNLPSNAWEALHRENIETLDQLKANGGWLELYEGIEPQTAQVIRLELARVAAPEGNTSDEGQPCSWSG